MFKKSLKLVVMLAIAISAVGLTHPVNAQAKKLTIAFSMPDLKFPFFVNMVKQVQDEAAKIGNIDILVLDGQGQTDKQTADLEAAIAKKVDGILISPLTADAMAPAVQEAIDAKIPVITIDRDVSGDTQKKTLAHVAADNEKGGEQQAQFIMKQFPNGAKLFNLTGTPGATPAILRAQGLHTILDPVKDKYKLIFEQTGNFARDKGQSVTESGLTGQGTPDVINAANDDMALGAVEALRDKNLVGKVVVIGFDALPEALLSIKKGELTATVEQFPGGQSRASLQLMVDFLRNQKSPAQHDTLLTPKLISKDNLNEAERIAEIEATPGATMAATAAATAAPTQAK